MVMKSYIPACWIRYVLPSSPSTIAALPPNVEVFGLPVVVRANRHPRFALCSTLNTQGPRLLPPSGQSGNSACNRGFVNFIAVPLDKCSRHRTSHHGIVGLPNVRICFGSGGLLSR